MLCSAPCIPASKRTLWPNAASASTRRRGDAGRSHAPTTGAGQGSGQHHAAHRQGGRPTGRTARPGHAKRERGTWATVTASTLPGSKAGRVEDRRGRLCRLSKPGMPWHTPPSGQGEARPWPEARQRPTSAATTRPVKRLRADQIGRETRPGDGTRGRDRSARPTAAARRPRLKQASRARGPGIPSAPAPPHCEKLEPPTYRLQS